jgi:hypothetical protein
MSQDDHCYYSRSSNLWLSHNSLNGVDIDLPVVPADIGTRNATPVVQYVTPSSYTSPTKAASSVSCTTTVTSKKTQTSIIVAPSTLLSIPSDVKPVPGSPAGSATVVEFTSGGSGVKFWFGVVLGVFVVRLFM